MPGDDLRRFAALFECLVAPHDQTDSDKQSARRLLAHTLHNYVELTGSDGADSVERALPWMRAYTECSDDASPEQLVELLETRGALAALDAEFVRSRVSTRADTDIQRSPMRRVQSSVDDESVIEMAELERRLYDVSRIDPTQRWSRLLCDSTLLATTVELVARGARTEATDWLSEDVIGSRVICAWRPTGRERARGLWTLVALESGDQAVLPSDAGRSGLPTRKSSFERGLAVKLDELGISPAVRLALAVGGAPRELTGDVLDISGDIAPFDGGPELLELARALAEVRGVCFDVSRGHAKVERLRPWITYLRQTSSRLATGRKISQREATGYAHYAFHLMNICDLAASNPAEATAERRDELLELAEHLRSCTPREARRITG